MFTAVPERKVVFTGSTGAQAQAFEMKPHIVYPMLGGTALITFEEEVGESDSVFIHLLEEESVLFVRFLI